MTTATSPTASGLVQNAEYTDQPVEMTGLWPIVLKLPEEVVANGHDACANWFWELCIANDESAWQIELNASGELEIMPPTDEPADRYEISDVQQSVYLGRRSRKPGRPDRPHCRIPSAEWCAARARYCMVSLGKCSPKAGRRSAWPTILSRLRRRNPLCLPTIVASPPQQDAGIHGQRH